MGEYLKSRRLHRGEWLPFIILHSVLENLCIILFKLLDKFTDKTFSYRDEIWDSDKKFTQGQLSEKYSYELRFCWALCVFPPLYYHWIFEKQVACVSRSI